MSRKLKTTIDTEKTCARCGKTYPREGFYVVRKNKLGTPLLSSYCHKCYAAYAKETAELRKLVGKKTTRLRRQKSKKCNSCKRYKDTKTCFRVSRVNKIGVPLYGSYCKECSNRKLREKNAAKQAALTPEEREAKRLAKREYDQAYTAERRERLRAQHREYYKRTSEERKAYQRWYKKTYPERVSCRNKSYYERVLKSPERKAINNAKARAAYHRDIEASRAYNKITQERYRRKLGQKPAVRSKFRVVDGCEQKFCIGCKDWKPIESFNKDRKGKCGECRRAHMRKRYAEDPATMRARYHRYRKENPAFVEKIHAKKRKLRETLHPQYVKEIVKQKHGRLSDDIMDTVVANEAAILFLKRVARSGDPTKPLSGRA